MRDFKLYINGSALYLRRTDNNNSLFTTDALQVTTSWIELDDTSITITSNTDQIDVTVNIIDLETFDGIAYTYETLEKLRNANFKRSSGGGTGGGGYTRTTDFSE